MQNELKLNLISDVCDGIKTQPISLKFEDVLSFKKTNFYGGDHTFIRTSDLNNGFYVSESYEQVQRQCEDLRERYVRWAYVIPAGSKCTHYIPKDTVETYAVDENNHITLRLNSGDKFTTKKTMAELRASAIEVYF